MGSISLYNVVYNLKVQLRDDIHIYNSYDEQNCNQWIFSLFQNNNLKMKYRASCLATFPKHSLDLENPKSK